MTRFARSVILTGGPDVPWIDVLVLRLVTELSAVDPSIPISETILTSIPPEGATVLMGLYYEPNVG